MKGYPIISPNEVFLLIFSTQEDVQFSKKPKSNNLLKFMKSEAVENVENVINDVENSF